MRKMMEHTNYQDAAKLLSDPNTTSDQQEECFRLLKSAILEGESSHALESVDCLHLLFAETPEFSSRIKEILTDGAGAEKAETEVKNACDYVLQDIEGKLVYVGDFEEEAFETDATSLPEAHSRPAIPPVLPALGEPESIKPQPLPFSQTPPTRLLFGLTVAAVLLSLLFFTRVASLREELTAVKAQTSSLEKELTAVKARLVLIGYRASLVGFKKRLEEERKPRNSAPPPCPPQDPLHCFPPRTS